jgi:CheY-like chemotaxis protein
VRPALLPRPVAPSAPEPPPEPSVRPPLTRVVLVGGTPENRLLLRGLLRLHRHRVAAEIPGVENLDDLVRSDERKVLILQLESMPSPWEEELAAALARDPQLLAIVLTASRSPDFDRRARAAGAHAVLQRPFTVSDLISTVEAVARGENALADGAPQP